MKIFNDNYEVCFENKGGEMTSFTNKNTGVQYLWQGDETYWNGKNPTLFPIVGNTLDHSYEAKGKTYHFENHGLIRYATLECVHQEDTVITFELSASAETLKVYPYHFLYKITYTLVGNKIQIDYDIKNEDEETMPFTFGMHPGFRCPLLEGESYSDYKIEFEKEEKLEQLLFDVKREMKHHYVDVTLRSIPLTHDLFQKNPTLIYRGMQSSYVTLSGPKHKIRVSISGFPFLAFWTPQNDAPFICIEPWYSHADFEANEVPFAQRIGMFSLNSKETWETSYSIEVD